MSNDANLLRMLEPSVRPTGSPALRVQPKVPIEQQDFKSILNQQGATAAKPLKLSGHAQQRLAQSQINLNDAQMDAFSSAADKAEAKGSRNALMMMEQLGMIVNIPNRTVLTILSPDRMRDGVVTQIDSTVLVEDPSSKERQGLADS